MRTWLDRLWWDKGYNTRSDPPPFVVFGLDANEMFRNDEAGDYMAAREQLWAIKYKLAEALQW